MSADAPPAERWLPLKQAAEKLGVHPATLRRWANHGDLPFLLTPGGHRRFALSDLDGFAAARRQRPQPAPVIQVWAEKAISRARRDMAQQETQPWLATLDDSGRERHRTLGRQLMGLTLQYISAEAADTQLIDKARKVGHEYGRISHSIHIPLTDALQAAMFFRDTLVEVALELPENTRVQPEANLRLMRRINTLLNAVHLAIAEIYEIVIRDT